MGRFGRGTQSYSPFSTSSGETGQWTHPRPKVVEDLGLEWLASKSPPMAYWTSGTCWKTVNSPLANGPPRSCLQFTENSPRRETLPTRPGLVPPLQRHSPLLMALTTEDTTSYQRLLCLTVAATSVNVQSLCSIPCLAPGRALCQDRPEQRLPRQLLTCYNQACSWD